MDPVTTRRDATWYLTGWLSLLFAIPANQVLGPLGAIGTPALVVAGGATLLWVASRSMPTAPRIGVQPVRLALFVYVWYQLATIAFAHTRALTLLEQTASLREAFTLMCLSGIALLVIDGVDSLDRLETLLRRLMFAGSFLAVSGIVQFVTGRLIILRVPGLSANQAEAVVNMRSIFNRPYGTALHPIEFGVVLAVLLPVALFFVMNSEARTRQRQVAIAASAVIGLAVPLSISRSGIVSLVGVLAVLWLGWSWRQRVSASIVGVVALPALWLGIPGLVGTFRGMFTSFESDPSVQARLDRVPKIMGLIREYPLFGRGAGTYSIEDYFLVDNEFWVSTIETGIVGIASTYALFLLACGVAITSRHHRLATPRTTQMGYAIAAGVAGVAVSLWTFDAFFYQILRGVLFLLIGMSGALWRLTRGEPAMCSSSLVAGRRTRILRSVRRRVDS